MRLSRRFKTKNNLDQLLASESCKFDKALTPDQWCELFDWCNQTFGKKNWFIDENSIKFTGCCPVGSAELFLLRWL